MTKARTYQLQAEKTKNKAMTDKLMTVRKRIKDLEEEMYMSVQSLPEGDRVREMYEEDFTALKRIMDGI